MSTKQAAPGGADAPLDPRRVASAAIIALALCFFLSGAASLAFEMVWNRLLRLVFGSTTLAVSTVLVAYMLGLGLGGLLGGRLAARLRNGVAAYGFMEIGIGVYAVAVPWLLERMSAVSYAAFAGAGFWEAAVGRFVLALAVLLLPTLLMGATLPILAAAVVDTNARLGSRIGLFYGLNTLGAVAGILLSIFVLFPHVGLRWTNWTAAGLDILIGVLAITVLAPRFQTAGRAVAQVSASERAQAWRGIESRRATLIVLSYATVGFTALVYEVCWTRILSLVLGSSIYAFAIMLAAFLTGIAGGSLVARRWLDRVRQPLLLYALGLVALGAASLATVASFGVLPRVFGSLMLVLGLSGGGPMLAGMAVSMLVMLGPTLVLGALFPLVTRCLASGPEDVSRVVGSIYFANTLGAATGALLAGFVLIPLVGLRATLVLAIVVNALAAAVVLFSMSDWPRSRRITVGLGAVAAGGLAFLTPHWDPALLTRGFYLSPWDALDYGVHLEPLHKMGFEEELLLYRDGINTTVSVHRHLGGLTLRVNGKIDASTGADMSTQVLSGHIPMLFGPQAKRVLVIGLASGVTVGSVALDTVEQIDVVELESTMVEAADLFADYNRGALDRPNVRVITEDGRSFLRYNTQRYDVIISEPSNPWITGASSLFTREAFHNAREALNPGGRLLQWVQLYSLDTQSLRAIIAALRAEFPYVYGFVSNIHSTDLLLLARTTPLGPADLPRWESLAPVVQDDLRRVNVLSTADLWSLLQLGPEAIDTIVGTGSPVNSDDSMLVELSAPWGLYDSSAAGANQRFVYPHRRGAVATAEAEGGSVSADFLAELALSHLVARDDPPLAAELLRESRERGGGPLTAVTEAELNLRQGGDPRAVLRSLVDQVDGQSNSFAAHLQRAQLELLNDDAGAALADADAAITLQPGDPRPHVLRFRALAALGRAEEAEAEAQSVLQSRYDPELLVLAARVSSALGRGDEAISRLRRYLEMRPFSADEWTLLAKFYADAGRLEDARDASDNAQRSLRNAAALLYQRGRRAGIGSRETAMQLLRQALAINPDYEPARRELERLEGAGGELRTSS